MSIKTLLAMTFIGFSLMATTPARADYAAGIILGDPTGFSGRMSLDNDHSAEMALAFSSGYYRGLHVHGTYLWDHARSFATQGGGPINLYYGLGVRLISINNGDHDGDLAIGPRAPLGLLYNIHNPNIEIFGEISAALDVAPDVRADLDIGIGCRIRF